MRGFVPAPGSPPFASIEDLSGGCFCGEVRCHIVPKPVMQLFCYCNDCRRLYGTDGYAGYMVKNEDFVLTAGAPTAHTKVSKEGRAVVRHFCGTCGSTLYGQTAFDLVSILAGTLDTPKAFVPTTCVFTEDAPTWARLPDCSRPH
jgi:hypothetical protein